MPVNIYRGLKFLLLIFPFLLVLVALIPPMYQYFVVQSVVMESNYSIYALIITVLGGHFCILNYLRDEDE